MNRQDQHAIFLASMRQASIERVTIWGMRALTAGVENAQDRQVAENIATLIHRIGIKQGGLAVAVGMTGATFSRRMKGQQPWLLWEVAVMADFLGVTIDELAGTVPPLDVWRARRDSNPQPSDWESVRPLLRLVWSVKPVLTPNRRPRVERTRHLRAVS